MTMKEYDLYVPLYSNRGVPLPPTQLARLKKRLVKRFGGLTYFPQKTEGFWKIGAVTFRDEVVILRVLCEEKRSVQLYWSSLKEELKKSWKQNDVLIVVRAVSTV